MDKTIDLEFLREAVSRFDEDDAVKPMLTDAVRALSEQLSKMTMDDNYRPYMDVCQALYSSCPIKTDTDGRQ